MSTRGHGVTLQAVVLLAAPAAGPKDVVPSAGTIDGDAVGTVDSAGYPLSTGAPERAGVIAVQFPTAMEPGHGLGDCKRAPTRRSALRRS